MEEIGWHTTIPTMTKAREQYLKAEVIRTQRLVKEANDRRKKRGALPKYLSDIDRQAHTAFRSLAEFYHNSQKLES